jgi:hypothetical protein
MTAILLLPVTNSYSAESLMVAVVGRRIIVMDERWGGFDYYPRPSRLSIAFAQACLE